MRLVAAPLAAALVIAPAVTPFSTAALIPAASAACPDAEVVFARGREEPPGVGAVGDALVNSLRCKMRMSVGVYGVNYPANLSTASGANDMSAHVQSMAGSCPNTRMVLGGYSLGAAVADLVTGGSPTHCRRVWISTSQRSRCSVTAPSDSAPPAFAGKTIDQCADGDPICGRGLNWPSHLQPSYIDSGLVDQAASFVAGKL